MPRGGTALDAVVRTITIMEDSGLFNAGLGGILQLDGVRRLDASLMEGKTLKAGCVIGLERIRNPIQAAKLVMKTPHVMLTNLGAQRIVKGLAPLPEPDAKTLAALERAKKNTERRSEYMRSVSPLSALWPWIPPAILQQALPRVGHRQCFPAGSATLRSSARALMPTMPPAQSRARAPGNL